MAVASAETHISWQAHEGPCVSRVKGFDIIHCEMCGFRHAVPLPDPREMEREYRETYYAEEKPTFLAHAGEDQQWAELAQADRLESFERIVGAGTPAPARHRVRARILPEDGARRAAGA